VSADLQHTLNLDSKYWDMRVVIREWLDFDIGMEFRGFVVSKKLCALAQYNDMVYYENLQGKEVKYVAHLIIILYVGSHSNTNRSIS
jgi:hypothetical protein